MSGSSRGQSTGIIIPAKVREQLELAQAPKPRITSTEAELTARELLIQKHRSPEAMPTPPVPKQITKAMEKAQTNKVASKPTKKVKNKPAKTSARLVKVENGGEVPIFLKTTSGHQMSPVTVTPRVTPSTGIQSDGPLSRAGKSRVERAVSFTNKCKPSLLTKGVTAGVMLSMELHRANLVNGTQGLLVLKARRGAILKEAAYCSVCHTSAAPLYRYADSNYGPIILCSVCKTPAFEHSYGYADAMPLAVDHAHAHKGKW